MEVHLDYKEFPIMLVYIKSFNKRGDMLTEINKIYKTLRQYAKIFRVKRLVAVVTSFKYWHFLQYDITREVDQVCGA